MFHSIMSSDLYKGGWSFHQSIYVKTQKVKTMRVEGFSLIVFFIVLVEFVDSLDRGYFPMDFIFGTASSSYQVYVLSKRYFLIQHIIWWKTKTKTKKCEYLTFFLCDWVISQVWRCSKRRGQGTKYMGHLHAQSSR